MAARIGVILTIKNEVLQKPHFFQNHLQINPCKLQHIFLVLYRFTDWFSDGST